MKAHNRRDVQPHEHIWKIDFCLHTGQKECIYQLCALSVHTPDLGHLNEPKTGLDLNNV